MKRILVIDDNEDIRMIIGYSLMKAGYQVDDAEHERHRPGSKTA